MDKKFKEIYRSFLKNIHFLDREMWYDINHFINHYKISAYVASLIELRDDKEAAKRGLK